MPGPPRHHPLPLALATLALALATWWALDLGSGPGEREGQVSDGLLPTFPDQPELTRDTERARPSGPEADARAGSGARTTPPPARPPAPPERIVPDVPAPPTAPPDGDGADDGLPPLVDDEAPVSAQDPGASAAPSRVELLPGVGSANARATEQVDVPAGTAWIGTPLPWVRALADAAVGQGIRGLLLEAPRHAVAVETFHIDRFEVTNHRYARYLEEAARVVYDTGDHPARTLAEIAAVLIVDPPANLDLAGETARQLYRANEAALHAALPGVLVEDPDGTLDRERTWERLRERLVPAGVRLAFYDHAPPGPWPDGSYPPGEVDHPVRDLSLEEALDFALWAGRHVPTEVEWEYAARGPSGLDYPWGSDARGFSERVNGGRPREQDEAPATRPVLHFADGASWIGCFQMLGNVAEWTSSWLDPYPGSPEAANPTPATTLVVRGGSAHDENPYLVRPALRGVSGTQPGGAPRPRWRLPWAGFRTARYDAVGRSRLPTMHYLARRGGWLRPEALGAIYSAWVGRLLATRERVFGQDGATVPGGVKSFVLQPFPRLLWRRATDALYDPARDAGFGTAEEIVAASASGRPVLLGLLHTDLHLVDLWQSGSDGAGVLGEPERLRRAEAAPGTWLVGVLHGQLALLRPDLRGVVYVTNRGLPQGLLGVPAGRAGSKASSPAVDLRLDGGSGRLEAELEVPLAGPDGPPGVVVARLHLRAEPAEVALVKRWAFGAGG